MDVFGGATVLGSLGTVFPHGVPAGLWLFSAAKDGFRPFASV